MRSNDDIIRVLNEERTKKNLSISELSRRVGMAKSALSRYFNKTREFPLNKAEDFANALEITTEYLLGFEEEQPSTTLTQITDTSAKLEEQRQEKVYNFAEKQLEEQNSKITSLEQHRQKRQRQQELREIDWCGAVSAGTGEFLSDDNKEKISLPIEVIPDG
ncbi:TPA: helix-turn-helix domain-containing protein, partial [Enterococcus faecalis]